MSYQAPGRAASACMLVVLVFSFVAYPAAMAADRVTGKAFATRSEVIAPEAMAAIEL